MEGCNICFVFGVVLRCIELEPLQLLVEALGMRMISLTLGANVVGMLSFDNDTTFP